MPYKMFLLKITVLAAMVWVSLDTPALSQGSPIKRMGAELSKEDIELLKRAAAKLYEPVSVPVGTTEAWTNSDSGNSGIVTLIKIFEKQGMPADNYSMRYGSAGNRIRAVSRSLDAKRRKAIGSFCSEPPAAFG